MKFSHQLKFNSVPDWKDKYLNYDSLRRIIFEIARLEHSAAREEHDEAANYDDASGDYSITQPLTTRAAVDARQAVLAKEEQLWNEMDSELKGIITFYMHKEADVLSKLEALDLEVHTVERSYMSIDLPPVPGSGPHAASLPWSGSSGHARRPSLQIVRSGSTVSDGGAGISPGTGAQGRPGTISSAPAVPGQLEASTQAQPAAVVLRVAPISETAPVSETATPEKPSQQGTSIGVDGSLTLKQRARFWRSKDVLATSERIKRDCIDLYTTMNDLIEYLCLNREGFRKLVKKHDKLTSSNLKDVYWADFERRYPIKRKDELERQLARVVELYAVVIAQGDYTKANNVLKNGLREHIKVERSTVWRDMVAMERKTMAATVEANARPVHTPWYQHYTDKLMLLLSLAVFGVLLKAEIFVEPEKCNCLAMLAFVSMLWATEAIPLFATSMLVPVLVVTLQVLVDRSDPAAPKRLTPQQAAPTIFHAMFSQVIMLLLGGFTIAAALSKHFIAKQLAVAVLSRVGRRPRDVLLAAMFVATFASMWISNVAAPVLCFSIVQPILKTMDVSTPFAKALVMGIALASNIGGMTSPISSPQNIFAIERMSMDGHPPSWLAWFAVAVPVAIICNLLCWGVILVVYQPGVKTTEVRPLKPSSDPITWTQVYVIAVSVATVGLWCANSALQRYTGEMGVVAVLPMIAFFGFGVLSKDDFNGFLWNVVMLAMGGSALGEAVKSSGLLLSIAEAIKELVDGLDLWTVMFIFCACVLVSTTFISHTVGAMVILPIVQSVGEAMPGKPHPKLLVMSAALMCSGAMGLPVSGFPNMNAVCQEDSTGQTFVNTLDFVKVGIISSVFAFCIITSLGYVLMLLVGL